jgi:hypothetical protein
MADANLGFVRTVADVQNNAPQRTLRLDTVSGIDFVEMADGEKKLV